MVIVLALGAAAFYGSADYMGAIATRRSAVLAVAFGAQLTGLVFLLATLPFLAAAAVTGADLAHGAAAGVFGATGLVIVYRSLARGPMSVVAPTTALSASVVPVIAGVVMGERPGTAALVGIAVALVAAVLITRERPGDATVARGDALRALLPALGGGAIFGLFFVFLHQAGDQAGLWPLLGARLSSVAILAVLLVARRVPAPTDRSLLVPVLLSGAMDMGANILFLLASQQGMLAVVAAITGLYPASTVVLAQTRLGERMAPVQFAGLGVAALAAGLVAV